MNDISNNILTPADFAKNVSNGKWLCPPHLQLLNDELYNAVEQNHGNIIVNMPPRHGKSEFISKYFPAWYLGNFPNKRIILSSYETRFATSWGRKIKELLDEFGERTFNIKLNQKARSSNYFAIDGFAGEMSCVGAGGAITGKGADLFIIDDPIKNDAQANSSVIRENVWNWFLSTAFTRLEPDAIMLIVMTRWHEDDLTGRLLSNEHNIDELSWQHISLPALAKRNDVLGRKLGDPLWKERFSREKLLKIKNMLGSYWFNALYQQTPSPAEGKIFKRKYFKYFIYENNTFILNYNNADMRKFYTPKNCTCMIVMDLAAKVTQTSDYTAALVFYLTNEKDVLIFDVVREKFEGADHIKLIKSLYEKYNPILIGIENTQYQISLIQNARRQGYPVKELKADKDKISRSLPIAALLESGNVYFLNNAVWLDEFEKELLGFPNAKNDDQVDAFAYIATLIKPVSSALPVSKRIRNEKII